MTAVKGRGQISKILMMATLVGALQEIRERSQSKVRHFELVLHFEYFAGFLNFKIFTLLTYFKCILRNFSALISDD